MWNAETFVVICGVFILAGFVKGVTGVGLPTVSVGLLTAIIGLKQALALALIPTLLTNLWQGLFGGHLKEILPRLWMLFAAGAIGIVPAVMVLARGNAKLLSGLLGLLLFLNSVISLAGVHLPEPKAWERPLSPLVGFISGALTGLTGSLVFPSVLYLQALRLPKDIFIQAFGLWCLVVFATLGLALQNQRLLSAELGLASLAAIIPAILGVSIGQIIRNRLSEQRFRQVMLWALMILGAHIALSAVR